MQNADIEAFIALPAPQSSKLLDFESVEVRPGFVDDTYFLIVSGIKPWITMTVALVPLIYIHRPDYWGIEVVGQQSGIGLPAEAPYTAVLDISHLRGTTGIEVIGATHTERVDI